MNENVGKILFQGLAREIVIISRVLEVLWKLFWKVARIKLSKSVVVLNSR